MAKPAHNYHRGEMDIHEQVATFNLFTSMTKWGSLYLAALLLFLVLWFCTGAGFTGALVTGLVASAGGTFALRNGGKAPH
jgi:hypothetical protein